MSGEEAEMTPSKHSNDREMDQLRPFWQQPRDV
jgi:hypothetical protein